MVKYFCDRCKEEVVHDDYLVVWVGNKEVGYICRNCWDKLWIWMQNEKVA